MAAVAAPPAGLPRGPTPNPPRPSSSSSRRSTGGGRESREKSTSVPQSDVKVEDVKTEEDPNAASNPQRPPIRPQASKFDLEVNPFEQSFAGRSQHSNSSTSDRGATPPRGTDATSIKHNALPPLSSLTSPAAADPSQFPWLASQSLRTGPLSPAMLAGPRDANGNPAHGANGGANLPNGGQGGDGQQNEGGFDSSTFRTGFTPGTGSGFTPGYSSLVGNNFASSLPMPSPNTAAFLNMVTNSTPIGEGGEEGQQQQQQGNQPAQPQNNPQPNGAPPHPPNAIPPHMQQQLHPGPPPHGLSHLQNSEVQDTITPNTLSALTGAFNDMSRQQQQQAIANGQGPPPQGHPAGAPPHAGQPQFYPPMQHPQPGVPVGGPPGGPPGNVDYAQQSANAASQAANGLFLLSQAHQELSKREEREGSGPGRSPPKPGPGGRGANGTAAANGRGRPNAGGAGQKRKSDASLQADGAGGAAPKAPKRGRKASAVAKVESTSPMSMGDTGDDDDDHKDGNGSGKPETEEEKRKNFLERNRQAALKCRQRKKAWLQELQTKVEQLTVENERLQQTIGGLHDEVGRLSSVLMQHRDCGLGIPTGYGRPIR